ncbi:hypothetical protein K491DRAFT_697736 [Lophiostoma macrostomum CBS 122681]|uniref:YjgF-like protein n=1 Tax=Lophiostoma macrostomum CBS 122681 TaxID=1314788 RepID=A0A6A6STV2_9PLEO|nr:hypothetical protein K491DRAFT_697736 [Lophiostoma macrostomum CBS 122681]
MADVSALIVGQLLQLFLAIAYLAAIYKTVVISQSKSTTTIIPVSAILVIMVSFTAIFTGFLLATGTAVATLAPKLAEQPVVTYLGTQGPILSSGAFTTKGIVYTSGTVPSVNGTIIEGGIAEQTAQVIKNIAAVLEEAGTSWDYVLKTTVFLANMSDYTAMNEVYGALLPTPKPARTAVEVGKLPGDFLIEVEAIAAIPDS